MALKLLLLLLPWPIRRMLLQRLYGYELHRRSRIGLAWVYPDELIMGAGTRIGALTLVKGVRRLVLEDHASIGRLNWITAYPAGGSPHFIHQTDRCPDLLLARHSAITNRHIIDCTDRISIGEFATVAGFRSQLLTHSINLKTSRQEAKPISIGAYTFVGTACTVLGGAALPDCSVLGANSLLNKPLTDTHRLYGGVPATVQGELDPSLAYFHRPAGFVT